ncbi:MAG: hypothetical protein M3421_10505, partial [Bacteroidota bacterium]|nr:hypothetical protein [Bacteroidota bacterium]
MFSASLAAGIPVEVNLTEVSKTHKEEGSLNLMSCDFDIALEARSDVTNCNNPNGKLSIRNTVESLNANYSIVWYNSQGTIVSKNSQASNLDIGSYVVHVTKKATNCTVIKNYYVGVGLPDLSTEVLKNVEDCREGSLATS